MSDTRIRTLRKAEGWTQERLAESSGVAVRTIQRLEAGDEASLETLTSIARALEVPVKELFTTLDGNSLTAAIERLDRLHADEQERRARRRTIVRRAVIVVGAILLALVVAVALIAAITLAVRSSVTPSAPAPAVSLTTTG